jgi:hypothetical protein
MLKQIRSYVLDVISILLVICISAAEASYNISKQGMDYNEGVFLTVGAAIAKGSVLYRDIVVDHGMIISFLLSRVAPDPSQLIYAHYLQAVVFVLCSLMAFVVGRMVHSRLAGLVATLLLLSDPLMLFYRVYIGPENWLSLFGLVTLACLLVWFQSHGRWWLVFAGAAAAAAFWAEQFGAVSVVLVLLAVVRVKRERKRIVMRDDFLAAVTGMLVISAPFLTYLIINNVMIQFVQYTIGEPFTEQGFGASGILYRMSHIGSGPWYSVESQFLNLENNLLWPLFLAYLILTSWRWGRDGRTDKSILFITYFSLFYLLVIFVYSHNGPLHILPLTPVIAIGVASFIVSLFEREMNGLRALCIRPSRIFQLRFNLISMLTCIFLLAIICVSVINVPSTCRQVQGWKNGDPLPPSELIAYIDRWTAPNQRILALSLPYTYYLSERQPAIPYFFLGYESYSSVQFAEMKTAIDMKSVTLVVVNFQSSHQVERWLIMMVSTSPNYHLEKYFMYNEMTCGVFAVNGVGDYSVF